MRARLGLTNGLVLAAMASSSSTCVAWKVCNVRNYGAKGDNKTSDTAAIIAAVTACKGGGEVRLSAPGTFLTGPFNLTDNQVLHVEAGATLSASQVLSDFEVQPSFPSYGFSRDSAGAFNSTCRYSAVVGGVGVENVSLTGGGTLDGNGWMFWAMEAQMSSLIAACKKKWTDNCRSPPLDCSRPHLVEFEHSSGISLTNLILRNSPFWTTHFIYSTSIFVKDIEVYAPFTQGNTDGINPDSSSNVHIENLYVANGDDGVAIKSGLNEAGIRYNRPTTNVTIRNMTTPKGCRGGIAIGSEMSGGVRGVRIENVALHGQRGIHMKTSKGRGGFIENITIVNYTGSAVQLWDSYGSTNTSGPWPFIGNFTLRHVNSGCSLGCGKMPTDHCFSKTFDVGPHSCGHHG